MLRPSHLLALAAALAVAAPQAAGAGPRPRYVDGELLVRWRDPGAASRLHAASGAAVLRRDARLGLDRVRLPVGAGVEESARRYARDPAVRYAEPNWLVRAAAVPDDPLLSQQWGLDLVSAAAAWDVATGTSVVVAVLDTGVRLDHPDLAASLWTNDDPPGDADGDGDPDDDGNGYPDDLHGVTFDRGFVARPPLDDDLAESHGTHVAGIVAASGDNGVGIAGVAWGARIMAVKFLHRGAGVGTVADAVLGLTYAVDNGARVVNCSFEFPDEEPVESQALADAFADADARGVLVVTSAGNAGAEVGTRGLVNPMGGLVPVPASIRSPGQLAVAAVSADGALAGYSNRGARTVDVAAPGGASNATGILSTVARCLDGNRDGVCDVPGTEPAPGYASFAGTSMAAPHAAGVAALVWAAHPGLSHRQVKARILNGAAPEPTLAGVTLTGGRLDAAAAVSPLAGEVAAVFRVTPYIALPGDLVTLEGANFGAAPGTARLGDSPLGIVSWSDESIVATVPGGAASGLVRVNGEGTAFPLLVGGAPLVTLSATPRWTRAPAEVTFAAAVEDAGEDVLRHEWDFGSGEFREYPDLVTTTAVVPSYLTTVVVRYDRAGLYRVRTRVTDAAGRSAEAERLLVVAEPAGDDPRCFIATAAWGSPDDPRVRALRGFRDRVLAASAPGRALVRAYYAASPPIAAVVRRHPALRAAVRVTLVPLVLAVEHPAASAAAVAAVLSLLAAVARRDPSCEGRAWLRGTSGTARGPPSRRR